MTDPNEIAKQQIIDLVAGYSVETTPGTAAKIPDYRAYLAPGTTVSVTFLAGSDFGDTVATAKRLKSEGFRPAPHFAARSFPDLAAFEDGLARMTDGTGVETAVALAGGVSHPVGSLENSMQLIESGLFEKYGIRRIGVAGHPEGSPDIAEPALAQALAWKNAYAATSSAKLYIATQFCFEAAPVIAWDKAIRRAGNRLPIRVGIPGLATLKTLINHARICGIGPSMRVLTRQARNITRLMTLQTPDKLLLDLARYKASDPECGLEGLHIYPLGGLRKTAAWLTAIQEGDFTVHADGSGFTVNRPIE